MFSGPTSRAVGRLKEEEDLKKKMTKSVYYPYLTLTGRSSDAGILCG